ncbi:MAG: DUF2071 domain-containing protein [Proteobacteria bacterium]|nr:MAG: DUF2071 domain-containing protein [Pseudomonadota bacterium]
MEIDRMAPTRRPEGARAGAQKWRHLLFAHWDVPAAEIAPLLPRGLSVDTFEGRAFVGLVPFTMRGVRPIWAPPLPGISNFHEVNVRTYVHREGKDPGVFFLSLDAASSLAVRVARAMWRLPYFRARMTMTHDGDAAGEAIDYASERLWPDPVPATLRARWRVGRSLGHAAPGTLEHFLVERYILYTRKPEGPLLAGRVHHAPYEIREASLDRLEDTLVAASGLRAVGAPSSLLASPGVDVEIYPLRAV